MTSTPVDKRIMGLKELYSVERLDGKPLKDGAVVLEWGDRNGRHGILGFSRAVRASGYGPLADDLDAGLARYNDPAPKQPTTTLIGELEALADVLDDVKATLDIACSSNTIDEASAEALSAEKELDQAMDACWTGKQIRRIYTPVAYVQGYLKKAAEKPSLAEAEEEFNKAEAKLYEVRRLIRNIE